MPDIPRIPAEVHPTPIPGARDLLMGNRPGNPPLVRMSDEQLTEYAKKVQMMTPQMKNLFEEFLAQKKATEEAKDAKDAEMKDDDSL